MRIDTLNRGRIDMTNLEIKKQQLEMLQREIKELESNNGLLWVPEVGEKYYSFTMQGNVTDNVWQDSIEDNRVLQTGNVYSRFNLPFLSPVEIKFRQIRNWVISNNDGWVADWNNSEQRKYCVRYNARQMAWSIEWENMYHTGATYMSQEMAMELIDILNKESDRDVK